LHPDIFDYLSPQSSSTPGPQLISLYSNLGGGTTTSSESGGPFPQAAVATSPSATVLSMTFPVLQETGSPTAKPPPSITTLGPILVVDSSGKTLFFTPTALPGEATGASAFITLVGGKTFIESPDGIKTGASGDTLSNFTVFGGKTFTEAPAPVITIINGQTYSALETPILTVISGQTFTEIAAAVPAVSHAIAFEYVDQITEHLMTVS
jgi:hypothetical protein